MRSIALLLLLVGFFIGCGGNTNKTSQTTLQSTDSATIVGNDRDDHGCIGSAGYTWSELRQECVRPFEAGRRMVSVTDPDATTCAYMLFSTDSLQVELFLPDREKSEILDRRNLPAGGYAWNVEDGDTFNVRKSAQGWIIERRGTTLYKQE